ncbi:hypothetical protein Ddc_06786 [Ditylenchus destructor]|nr:hypothetical protein Ddc_06786 [Ditylenchus destructor]
MNEGWNETKTSFTRVHVARHSGTASDLASQFVSSSTVDADSASPLRIDDVIVFVALESLGTLAITGNLCLIIVLLRNRYLHRASFILMLSLAIADVLHGRYNMIVTVKRIRTFTITCWTIFGLLNTAYILLEFCCLITPLKSNQFYTFGYGEFEPTHEVRTKLNAFTLTYSPIELATIAVLSISNPITLVQLYRRHKRKLALRHQVPPVEDYGSGSALKARSQWQRASTMLLEMSMRMGSKALTGDVRELATRRSNRQQQRILLQISVVAGIFYLYMTTYYLLYHVFLIENKWVVLFNR